MPCCLSRSLTAVALTLHIRFRDFVQANAVTVCAADAVLRRPGRRRRSRGGGECAERRDDLSGCRSLEEKRFSATVAGGFYTLMQTYEQAGDYGVALQV